MVAEEIGTRSAELILFNGTILTMDAENSVKEAMAVSNGRVIASGTNRDVLRLASEQCEVVDLSGKTVLPGFIEAHGHFPLSGPDAVAVNLNAPPIGRIATVRQAIGALRSKAMQTATGKWVVGFGYDDTRVQEMRLLNRQDLDAVSCDHPVYVAHISAHLGCINSAALTSLGITRDSPVTACRHDLMQHLLAAITARKYAFLGRFHVRADYDAPLFMQFHHIFKKSRIRFPSGEYKNTFAGYPFNSQSSYKL